MSKPMMRMGSVSGAVLLALMMVSMSSAVAPSWAGILKPPPKPGDIPASSAPAEAPVVSSVPKKSSEPVAVTPMKGAYDRDYTGDMISYTAKYEDTMVQIARTYNVGFVELRAANPYLDPWIPGEGKKIMIPNMHLLPRAVRSGLVVNLAEMRLYAFLKPGQVKTYPLGIGAEGLSTPSGTTSVVRKMVGPTWRPTPRMRRIHPELPASVGPGPDNPMGTNAMYLGWPEYAIHGTDKPFSIGRRASSGCMRMYPEDISVLFNMVPVGTTVTVVNQPVKLGWIGNKLYMEAHPTTDQADKMELDGGLPGYVFTEEDMGAIVAAAGEYARDLNWPLIRQVVRERRGYPVEIFRKPGAAGSKNDVAATKTEPKAELIKADVAKSDAVVSTTVISDSGEKADKPLKAEKSDNEKADQAEKLVEKAAADKSEKSDKADKADKAERTEKQDKPVKKVKVEKKAEAESGEDDAEPVHKVVISTPN